MSTKEIIWIGRGGQGAFTAAKLMGAACTEGYSLAFPTFGPERRGAPVRAFTKLSDTPVTDRSQTAAADCIAVLDKTLFTPGLFSLLKEGGKLIVNSADETEGAVSFDADSTAAELRLPVVNTVMLAYVGKLTGLVTKEQIFAAIDGYMPERLREKNKKAVERVFEG